MKEQLKPNQVRHQENLARFSGRFHGVFYLEGRVQRAGKVDIRLLPSAARGTGPKK